MDWGRIGTGAALAVGACWGPDRAGGWGRESVAIAT